MIAMVIHLLFGFLLYAVLFSLLTGAVASGVARIKIALIIPFLYLDLQVGFSCLSL
jgi:hypothetical protein